MGESGGGSPSHKGSSKSVLSFVSYNITGADKTKCDWLNDFCDEYDISFMSIQEHFKTVKTTTQWFQN